jgi:hypothetical protein
MIALLSIHDMSSKPDSPHACFVAGLQSDGLGNGNEFVLVPRHVNWVKGNLKGSASNLDKNPAIDAIVTLDSLSNTVVTQPPSAITQKNVMVTICGSPDEFNSAPSTITVTGFTNDSINQAVPRLGYMSYIYSGSGPIGILYDSEDPSAAKQADNVFNYLNTTPSSPVGVGCPVGSNPGGIAATINLYVTLGIRTFFVTLDPRMMADRQEFVTTINNYKMSTHGFTVRAIYGDADFVTGIHNGGTPLCGLLAYGVDRRKLAYRAGQALIPWVRGGAFPTGWTYPTSADFELYTCDTTAIAQLGAILPANIGGRDVHHV